MPITGLFLSDFDDYVRGSKEAVAATDAIGKSATDFQDEFNKAFAGVDIQRLLNDPVKEGASAVGELAASMGPLGQLSVIAAGALTAVGGAAFALASSTAAAGAELGDLADKTGLSIPQISHLATVAQLAGVDLADMASTITTMHTRMGKNPDAFAKGLQDIGINADTFFAMNPDEQFYAVAEALKAQEDPIERLKAGTQLLGTNYKNMAPAINDVAEAQERAAGIKVWTAEDVAQADAFQLHVNEIKGAFTRMGEELGRTVIPAFNDFFERLKDKDGVMAGFLAAHQGVKDSLGYLTRDLQTLAGTYVDTLPKVAGLDEVNKDLKASTDALHPPMVDAEAAMRALKEMTREDEAAAKAAEAENRKMAAAMVELNAAGVGWQGTLATINGDTVEAIKFYLEAGVAQGALATAYGLTDVQIRAVATSLREQKTAAKEAETILIESAKAQELAFANYEKAVRDGSRDTTAVRIGDIWRAAQAQIDALAKQGTATQETWDMIIRTAEQSIANITRKTLEQEVGTRSYYQRLAEEAELAYTNASRSADEYTAEHLERLRTEAEAAKTTLADWQTAANQALMGVKGAAEQALEPIRQVHAETKQATAEMYELGEAMREVGEGQLSAMEQQRGHYESQRAIIDAYKAAGIMTNISNVGGAAAYSSGIRGGYAPSYTIHVEGNVLSTKDDLARAVGDALTSHYRSGGNRLPV